MWHDAACSTADPRWFFPPDPTLDATERAKSVCRSCTIRDQCARWALDHLKGESNHGIWGATTPQDRNAVRAGRRTLAQVQAPPPVPDPPAPTTPLKAPPGQDRRRCQQQAVTYAAALGYTLAQLQRADRSRETVAARQRLAWQLMDDGFSSVAVGEVLHRDHSTILSAVRRVEMRATG